MAVRGRTGVVARRCRGIATVSGLPDPTVQTDRLRALGRAIDRRGMRMLRLILGREGVVVAARVTAGSTAPLTLRFTIAELDDLRVGARRERGKATSRSVGRPPSRLGALCAGAVEPFATWAGDAVPLAYEEVLRLVGQLLDTAGAAECRLDESATGFTLRLPVVASGIIWEVRSLDRATLRRQIAAASARRSAGSPDHGDR